MDIISYSYRIEAMDAIAKNYITMMDEGLAPGERAYEFMINQLNENMETLKWYEYIRIRENMNAYANPGEIKTENGTRFFVNMLECAIWNTNSAIEKVRLAHFKKCYEAEKREEN